MGHKDHLDPLVLMDPLDLQDLKVTPDLIVMDPVDQLDLRDLLVAMGLTVPLASNTLTSK